MNGPKRPGLQPRSALTPPDPLRRSTRPARISPSGRVSFLSLALCRWHRQANSLARPRFRVWPLQKGYDVERFGCVPRTYGSRKRSVVAYACFRRLDVSTSCDPTLPCRRGYLHMHSRRSPRNGAHWPSVAVRIFSNSMIPGAGDITTARHSSSIDCARPFA
jgi:hypothetical protein